jgi:putative ABC transport system permease protein
LDLHGQVHNMFLALRELLKEKARFVLIGFVIVLVSYLVFFLTALAYGLATSYTQGIDKWGASGIIMEESANDTLARSLLDEKDYKNLIGDDATVLGVATSTVEAEQAEDVAIFGIETDEFLLPNITEGRPIAKPTEIVVADELQDIGIELEQEISFKGSELRYTVVGFTDRATYQTSPIIYMDVAQWRDLASEIAGMSGMRDLTTVNGIVTKEGFDTTKLQGTSLVWQTIDDYSTGLPGYSAQVLTFSTMIGFLIAIASFVLAIFMYILTLQKKSIFGVLKAEGVPSSYIARSVVIQTILLLVSGMGIGMMLTLLSGAFLSSVIPFLVQPWFFVAIVGLFLLCAILGAIASVRAVTKIDPVEAIG